MSSVRHHKTTNHASQNASKRVLCTIPTQQIVPTESTIKDSVVMENASESLNARSWSRIIIYLISNKRNPQNHILRSDRHLSNRQIKCVMLRMEMLNQCSQQTVIHTDIRHLKQVSESTQPNVISLCV